MARNALIIAADYVKQRMDILPSTTLEIVCNVTSENTEMDEFSSIKSGEKESEQTNKHKKTTFP